MYRSVFAELFERIHRFRIIFRGITASAGAVLIQGYVEGDYLNKIRDMIRSELQCAGLAENLDVRYKIATAHSTIMRFRSQPRDIQKLIARLHTARDCDFGSTMVDQIDFVFNDWYMSHDRVEVLATYHLC
jgi:2'-5' RNA ligase